MACVTSVVKGEVGAAASTEGDFATVLGEEEDWGLAAGLLGTAATAMASGFESMFRVVVVALLVVVVVALLGVVVVALLVEVVVGGAALLGLAAGEVAASSSGLSFRLTVTMVPSGFRTLTSLYPGGATATFLATGLEGAVWAGTLGVGLASGATVISGVVDAMMLMSQFDSHKSTKCLWTEGRDQGLTSSVKKPRNGALRYKDCMVSMHESHAADCSHSVPLGREAATRQDGKVWYVWDSVAESSVQGKANWGMPFPCAWRYGRVLQFDTKPVLGRVVLFW